MTLAVVYATGIPGEIAGACRLVCGVLFSILLQITIRYAEVLSAVGCSLLVCADLFALIISCGILSALNDALSRLQLARTTVRSGTLHPQLHTLRVDKRIRWIV